MALHVWSIPSLSLRWKFKDVEVSTSDGEVFRAGGGGGCHLKARTGLEFGDKQYQYINIKYLEILHPESLAGKKK